MLSGSWYARAQMGNEVCLSSQKELKHDETLYPEGKPGIPIFHPPYPAVTRETVSPTCNWNLQLGLSISTVISTLNGQSPPEKQYLRLATGISSWDCQSPL